MTESAKRLVFEGVGFGYGRRRVLGDFGLSLDAGEVVLMVGPNGTGKTTALWLAEGLLRPDAGRVRVLGVDPFQKREVLGRVGFLAEGAPLPPSWRAGQVLDFQRGTFPQWDETECSRLMDRFAIDPKARVKQLSRGQRGKLALAAVLACKPEVLLLDEPTLGLDVATRRLLASEVVSSLAEQGTTVLLDEPTLGLDVAARRLLASEVISALSEQGTTVLLASHQIAEAEAAADRFALLEDGKIVCDESVVSLLERHRLLAWDADGPEPPALLEPLPMPERIGPRALARRWDQDGAAAWLEAGGREQAADLETIYLSMPGELEHA